MSCYHKGLRNEKKTSNQKKKRERKKTEKIRKNRNRRRLQRRLKRNELRARKAEQKAEEKAHKELEEKRKRAKSIECQEDGGSAHIVVQPKMITRICTNPKRARLQDDDISCDKCCVCFEDFELQGLA